jgi:predicted RNase H-like nuclease (RuvC/YqgF family)
MSKKGESAPDSPDASIQQIREIIFGDQITDLEMQVKDLKKECNHLKNRINDFEKKQADFDQAMAENNEKQKATTSDQHQIHDFIEQLKKEFDRRISEVNDAKVDKSQIGQAFIDWGMKVKQPANNKS